MLSQLCRLRSVHAGPSRRCVRRAFAQINRASNGELSGFDLDMWFANEMESIGESVRAPSPLSTALSNAVDVQTTH